MMSSMKLSKRQKKFLFILEEGHSVPWECPEDTPMLNNKEIGALREAGMIKYDETREGWVIVSPAGASSNFEAPWSRRND